MDQDIPFERIGGYRILRRLATGGTSDVLLARAEGPHGFERTVVLKLLLQQFRRDAPMEKMFAREAAAYARLSHPAIVKLYDFFSAEGQLVMVLEYIDGLPLNRFRAMLRKNGEQVDDRASIFVASRVFAALAAAHGARDPESGEFAPVIHRDVNPSNILIPWDGHVKLADFGIAKVAGVSSDTQAGFIKGTYGYMAPEQVRGEPITVRTDVYAASLLLWELLARRKAIQRGALPEIEVLRAMAEPTLPSLDVLRPDLPQRLREAIARGLEPAPDSRSVTAEEMLLVLRESVTSNEGRNVLAETLARVRQETEASRSGAPPGVAPEPPPNPSRTPSSTPPRPVRRAKPRSTAARGPPSGSGMSPPWEGERSPCTRPFRRCRAVERRGRRLRRRPFATSRRWRSVRHSARASERRRWDSSRTHRRPLLQTSPRRRRWSLALCRRWKLRSLPRSEAALPEVVRPLPRPSHSFSARCSLRRRTKLRPRCRCRFRWPDALPPRRLHRLPRLSSLLHLRWPQCRPGRCWHRRSPKLTRPCRRRRVLRPLLSLPANSAPPAPLPIRMSSERPPVAGAQGGRAGMYLLLAGGALTASAAFVAVLLWVQKPRSPTAAKAVPTTSAAPPAVAPSIPPAAPPPAPPPTATTMATATSTPAPSAPSPTPTAPAAPSADTSGDGEIVTPAKARGHRIFVDGHYAGDSPGPIRVRCGPHSLKVGSGGVTHSVNVPCGGQVTVGQR